MSVWMAALVLVSFQQLCFSLSSAMVQPVITEPHLCIKAGKVLDGNRCVEVSECSCTHMGRHFPPGSTVSQDCNTWYVHSHHSYASYNASYTPIFLSAVFADMDRGNAPTKDALVRQIFKRKTFEKLLFFFFMALLLTGECLVVGQSHFKSFDNKFFTFTGDCQYLLAKDCVNNEFSVIIENVQVTDHLIKYIWNYQSSMQTKVTLPNQYLKVKSCFAF